MVKKCVGLSVVTGVWLLLAQRGRFEGVRAGDGREIAKVKFRWAPAGSFVMGSRVNEAERRADEGPVEVTISRGFWVGQYEVTQGEWVKRMKVFPKAQDRGVGNDFPVHWVSFVEAEEYCRRLTAEAQGMGELPEGWEVRLPTEAQWEYACRAGSRTATSFGDRLTKAEANIGSVYPGGGDGERGGGASKVGSYPANA